MASPTSTGTDNGTETLQNKILNGASGGNSVTLLNEQGPTSALTGNATDQTVYTYTLPANTLAAGKGIRLRAFFNHNSGSATVTYKVFFGGTIYMNNSSTLGGTFYVEEVIFNNAGVTNAQHGSILNNVNNTVSIGGNGVVSVFSPLTSAIDTTQAVVIKLTFNVASTDQVTGGEFLVELLQ